VIGINLHYFCAKVLGKIRDELFQRAIGSEPYNFSLKLQLNPGTLLEVKSILEVGRKITLIIKMWIYCNN
jgi:hypothetical protein